MANRVTSVVVQGLDILDLIGFIEKKNKKFQAITLDEIEDILKDHPEEFRLVRKIILDTLNDYTRSVLRAFLGDIEYISNYDPNRR